MPNLESLGYSEHFNLFGDPSKDDDTRPAVHKRYYGKYRGTVLSNVDLLGQGRLLVEVTDAQSLFPSSWAMPCMPFAGIATGAYMLPAVGSGVWIEFEQGDADRPIWVGCFWGPPRSLPPAAEVSTVEAPDLPVATLETATCGISVCDVPLGPLGQVGLHAGPDCSIAMTEAGVIIIAPSVNIVTDLFSVNGVALTVA